MIFWRHSFRHTWTAKAAFQSVHLNLEQHLRLMLPPELQQL
jgi:hypothetical protein